MIKAVPTNVITGFLGVGKTSAIKHLLAMRPANERWAVLVNEFGEIGIDGSLLAAKNNESNGIFVREVPGGCMCCAAGLPMQIALTQLLKKARPDRLLIEPTGLGHPKEVLQVLGAEYNREAIALQKVITLVDARNISDQRYVAHATFNQQIQIADIVVANKIDLYAPGDEAALRKYIRTHFDTKPEILFTQDGLMPPALLEGERATTAAPTLSHNGHHHGAQPTVSDLPLPECGVLKASNEGEGFKSVGWRFSPDKMFNRRKLYEFLSGVEAERLKAVFITSEAVFGYNSTRDVLTEMELDDSLESRIEIIAQELDAAWETKLMACIEA